MTYRDIQLAAMRQSAIDCGCRAGDFELDHPVIVESVPHAKARKYLELPFACDLVSYGSNVVASVDGRCREPVAEYLARYPAAYCFETPALHVLDEGLRPYGLRVCYMAEYFLPDPAALRQYDCPYSLRLLGPQDFAALYLPAWSNALCEKRKELDVLGVGAYDGDRLVGLAACSADCDEMWQIGVDVLPGARRQGVAAAVTSRLTAEIFARGEIPFYCCTWANIRSARTAIKCGFRPAWAELTAKPAAFTEEAAR